MFSVCWPEPAQRIEAANAGFVAGDRADPATAPPATSPLGIIRLSYAEMMTPDELVAYFVDFAERHDASAPDTLHFMFAVAAELQQINPEQLAVMARSLDALKNLATTFFIEAASRNLPL